MHKDLTCIVRRLYNVQVSRVSFLSLISKTESLEEIMREIVS